MHQNVLYNLQHPVLHLEATEVPTTRVSVPIDDQTLQFMIEHAADLGLPPGASQARVLGRVLALGTMSLARQVRDTERERLYTAWADDPERLAAAAFHEEAAAETGAY